MAWVARRRCSVLLAVTVVAGTTATLPGSAAPAPLGAPVNGLAPTEIVTGDLNEDQVDDLVVANEGGNTLTIRFSDPAGGYQAPQRYPVGLSPSNVHLDDFTGDGTPDIVDVDGASSTLSVLPGRGDGTFEQAIQSPTVTVASAALAAADYNDDGMQDIAVSNPAGPVAVSYGEGNGRFAAPKTLPGPLGGIGITSADFNNDGKPDIASVGAGSLTQSVLLNQGDGTFQHVPVPIGLAAVCNRSADLNADGNVDLVAASADGHVGVSLGKGDGGFEPVRDFRTDALYSSCFGVDDLNHDGASDLAVGNVASGSMTTLLGKGDGTFEPARTHPTGDAVITCATANLNRDENADVVCPGGALPVVVAFMGNGDGTFQQPRRLPLG